MEQTPYLSGCWGGQENKAIFFQLPALLAQTVACWHKTSFNWLLLLILQEAKQKKYNLIFVSQGDLKNTKEGKRIENPLLFCPLLWVCSWALPKSPLHWFSIYVFWPYWFSLYIISVWKLYSDCVFCAVTVRTRLILMASHVNASLPPLLFCLPQPCVGKKKLHIEVLGQVAPQLPCFCWSSFPGAFSIQVWDFLAHVPLPVPGWERRSRAVNNHGLPENHRNPVN